MPRRDHMREILDPSSEALLAEHERLSSLYLHNAEMGERRTSLYLTIVSVSTVALFGLAQFRVDMTILLWPGVALLAVMLAMGVLTFQRLIERRIRGMEYLRAINRIHRYFVDHDPSLETYYYWAPCDDVPFHGGGSTAVTGLLDVIAALNSLFAGILVGVMAYALWSSLDLVIFAASGIVAGVITWFAHSRFELHSLRKAERAAQEYVLFPRIEG